MGLHIDREHFTAEDEARFVPRLQEALDALAALLARPRFGEGPTTVGAELELHLVDGSGRPLPINRQVLAQTVDPRMTVEINRFNLECNLKPQLLAQRAFSGLAAELADTLAEVRRAAGAAGARVAPIGVLPTLREEDLGSSALTALPRYRALSRALRRQRGGPFRIAISGQDSLALEADDVTLEGASTSLQFHLRVAPGDFARIFNAAQLATAPVLALAGNSPLFLGRRLWQETRVALFRQSVDVRGEDECARPSRVSFGHGWVRRGAHELFAEAVALHAPLLPALGAEAPLAVVQEGGMPRLEELRLHLGTVWSWNRPVYDPEWGGHLRVELRALPSGPTVADMVANGAFLLGLTLALSQEVEALLPGMPFRYASANFYRAARLGLEAFLQWPSRTPLSPRQLPARTLLPALLEQARGGLLAAGVPQAELEGPFALLAERLATGQTGARWQLACLARLERGLPREEALAAMLERYLAHAEEGTPVHRWPVG
jgi:hypothetical protein